jgi:hypothetical protein
MDAQHKEGLVIIADILLVLLESANKTNDLLAEQNQILRNANPEIGLVPRGKDGRLYPEDMGN